MADADTAMPDADTVMESEAGHEIPQDDYAASEDEFVSTKSVLMGSDEGLLTVDIANSKTSPDLEYDNPTPPFSGLLFCRSSDHG